MFDSQALSAQPNLGKNSDLAFVDATLPDYQSLITGFKSDTKIYILDPTGNELDQMSQILEQQSGVAGVHIFSHGSEGSLQFGETSLNSVDLSKYAEDLQRWKQTLTPGADILFYGCNVAQGEQGKAFVEQIHQLTGADVAVSDDLTGNATQGGNWDLEFSTGTIETLIPFNLPAVEAYEYVLATPLSNNINYEDFSSLNGLTVNGTAGQTNNVLNLTPATKNQVGSAFYNTPIGLDTNTSFNTHFQFQLSGGNGNNGADGFTFLLQNSTAGVKALGELGGSLGYGNQEFNGTNQILKSLAIEFDTYKNSWDSNNNHVAVLLNGDVTSPKAISTPSFQLNSGAVLDAWVDYDGSTNNLNVYVGNNTVKPLTALLNYNLDLTAVVGSQAYVGFSAGTGALTNSQNIDNWTFSFSNQTLTPGVFSFSQPGYSVNENGKTISVSVTRTDGSTGAASVNYATSDRTAKAGVDYILTSGVLNFIDGQTIATITIPVLDDSQLDPNLAFLLTLSNPTGGAELGLQKTSVITLLDDDASAVANVTTQHNDNNRTGADLNEPLLNTTNVNANQFGKLFSRPVDGSIYAQPLYLANVNIPNQGTHNVVYVATMHNTVYAFDADDPNASTPLWSTSLGPSVTLPDPNIGPYPNYRDISTEVGILSTPVISTTNNALYVVAFTKEAGKYIYRLHALDLTTGAEKFGGPVVISGNVPGTGDGSVDGVIAFTPNRQNQRPGLLLSNGKIYIAFASFGDKRPYHGWVFGYDATTLNQTSIYNATPNGGLGGIWQSGNGLSADNSGKIYLSTGNGTFRESGSNLGNSIIKFNPDLTVTDWFTPYNYARLNAVDDDLGSGGPLLIPNSNYLIAGGKEGKIYVLDRNNLGKFKAGGDTQIIQSFQAVGTAVNGVKPPTGTGTSNIHGTPIYWNGPNGPQIYLWGENDWARIYSFNGSTLNQNPIAISTMTVPPGMPGAMLSLSANDSTDGTGILWTSSPFDKNANQQVVTGILRAFDATTMTELWNSKQNITRDDLGNFAKFSPPTIANGKVYTSTFSGYLQVYGLLT
ncbi:DUF4347 domain-containing protein [Halotia wernerae UHCC 0503]|nr:DUF4347 domain-containing protein [Halotia wernerae UHCC 0503]